MPSTDRRLELKEKTSMVQTIWQPVVYAKGLTGIGYGGEVLVTPKDSNIGTKCNSLTQQSIRISTTIDTWATCFDSIESSSGPQKLQIQLLQGSQVHCGIPNAYIIVS